MAFVNSQNHPSEKFEKAKAFLNIYVPTKSGGRRKLGAVPLKDSNKVHAQIIKRLSEDSEESLQKLVELMEFDFVLVGDDREEDEIDF